MLLFFFFFSIFPLSQPRARMLSLSLSFFFFSSSSPLSRSARAPPSSPLSYFKSTRSTTPPCSPLPPTHPGASPARLWSGSRFYPRRAKTPEKKILKKNLNSFLSKPKLTTTAAAAAALGRRVGILRPGASS